MLRSRAVQYLGLTLLVLVSLGLIFYPVGPTPVPQEYTLTLTASKPWGQLAAEAGKKDKKLIGKQPSQIADAALVKAFPLPPLPKELVIQPDGKTATIDDTASNRVEAAQRARTILAALQTGLPGISYTAKSQTAIDNLPDRPRFSLGSTSIFPYQHATAIKLGLDLRGGVDLVLQVRRALFTYTYNQKTAPDDKGRDQLLNQVRAALARTAPGLKLSEADVNYTPNVTGQLEVRTQAEDEAQFKEQQQAIDGALATIAAAGFKAARAPQFFLPKTKPGEAQDPNYEKQRLARTVEIVRSRVDKLGVSEPLIQSQGNSRIIVQLPGLKDPQKAVEVIGTTARMEIRLLPETLVPVENQRDNVQFVDAKTHAPVPTATARAMSQLIVPGEDFKPNTTAGFAGDMSTEPAIFFELQGDSPQNFAKVTREVAKKHRFIPIFLDDVCISAPTVQSAITEGKGQISGGFKNIEEARQLALLLNSGALPAPIDVVENRTVSATLGSDSLMRSLEGGLIGLALVAIFMIVFYRLPGLLANCALTIYIVINLAAFIVIGGTLTLPGIAGFLLAVAMSLDTNILVFERLKEEMAIHSNFSTALHAAFARAWTAILDSHVTTLIAAAVLFNFGTGPVKGFALTLGIGVLLSLFSAISVTRLFMWSIVHVGERHHELFGKPAHITAPTVSNK